VLNGNVTTDLEGLLARPDFNFGSQQQEAHLTMEPSLEAIVENQEKILAALHNITSSLPSIVKDDLEKYHEKKLQFLKKKK
jgi:hypothetical protein